MLIEPIDVGEESVLPVWVAQLRDYVQPELGPFGLGQPKAQYPSRHLSC